MELFRDSSKLTFGVELDNNKHPYQPGDVIVGRIFRKTPVASPHATVSVRLYGQVRTKLPNYERQMTLIDQNHVIHDGPVHIPPGETPRQDWPFSLTIPTHIDSACLPPDSSKTYFLPLRREDGTTEQLPPTFDGTYDPDRKAVVEYTIKAEMQLYGQAESGKTQAALPVTIQYFSPQPPISVTPFNSFGKELSVSSHRLVPGKENTKLTASQRMKKVFGSRSVPTFAFKLLVGIPQFLQLGNPYFIPFQLKAVPMWNKTHGSIRKVNQKIKIKRFAMEIITHVSVIQMGNHGASQYWERSKIFNTNLSLMRLGYELEVPCDENPSVVDVGKAIKLQAQYDPEMNFIGNHLRPTFTTHLFRHVHILKWRIEVEVAGEVSIIEDRHYIRVLPPCTPYVEDSQPAPPQPEDETWIQPPPAEDPPKDDIDWKQVEDVKVPIYTKT